MKITNTSGAPLHLPAPMVGVLTPTNPSCHVKLSRAELLSRIPADRWAGFALEDDDGTAEDAVFLGAL